MANKITQQLGFDASQAMNELANLTGKLREANAVLREFKETADALKTGPSGSALDALGKKATEAKKKTQGLTISWQTMVRVIQTQIILRSINALINGLGTATENARQLGLAIAEIQTITPGGGGQFETARLTEDILRLSDQLGKAPKDLAEGLYESISNQVVELGDAFNFNAEAAKLATVTVAENMDAVNALSSVINSYGLAAGDASRISDTLFKTVEVGRLRLNEIGNILGRVLPLSSQLGISWEEVAASIATMTRQGVKADTALTQLRAIMQQMIRPGDELQAVFESWGVENAEQAVQVYGGFGGVMRKLAEETGGTSDEIGELFRRVRAVAGFFGTMADDGNELASSLDAISNSAGVVSDTFEKFTQTDAFKLTQETQKFENQWTRLGTTVMPAVNQLMGWINRHTANFAVGMQAVTGQLDDAQRVTNTFAEGMQRAADNVKKIQEEAARNKIGDQFKDALTKANQYYAELNKQEMNLRIIRQSAVDAANAGVKSATQGIFEFYAESTKALKKFIDDAEKSASDSASKISDIESKIEDRRLNARLEGARNAGEKVLILEREIALKRAEIFAEFAKLDATDESRDALLKTLDEAVKLADLGKTNARTSFERQKFESQAQGFLRQQQNIIDESNRLKQNAIELAKEEYAERSKNEGKIKELVNQIYETYTKLSGEVGKEEAKNLNDQLNSLKEQLQEIVGDAKLGSQLLQALGIDKNFDIIADGLSAAMDKAEKNWQAEVQRAKAAFENEVLNIKVAYERIASVDDAAQALGVQRQPGESTFKTAEKVQAAAVEQVNKAQLEQSAILEKRAVLQEYEVQTQRVLSGLFEETNRKLAGITAAEARRQAMYARRNGERITQTTALQRAEGDIARQAEKYFGTQLKIQRAYTAIQQQLQAGKTVTEDQFQALTQVVDQAQKEGAITAQKAAGYRQLLEPLREWQTRLQEVNQLEADLATEQAKTTYASEYLETVNQTTANFATQADAAAAAQQALASSASSSQTQATAAQTVATATGTSASNTQNIATAAANAQGSTGALAGNISAAIPAATTLANELTRAARAAAAASAGGGGSNNYFGRVKHFAYGGRGQDTIPAMLSKGETVVSSRNSRKFFSELNAMNQGRQPVYREQGGTVTNVGDINVTVQGGDSSQQTVREIGRALRREVQRGNLKLR
jgi:TP901 family phage tail tape measure protein